MKNQTEKVNEMNIASEILKYIEENAGTSFVEIERIFEKHNFDYKGELSLMSERYNNLVFWKGWNQNAVDILNKIIDTEMIIRRPTQVLTYYIDGKVLDMPVAQHYMHRSTVNWFPITFSPIRKGRVCNERSKNNKHSSR